MKVIEFKAAKAAIERRRYAGMVLKEFDRLERATNRQRAERRAEIERKARRAL